MPADTATLAAALSAPRWGSPEALDLSVAILSLALFAGYHAWYYSWHLWVPGEPLEAALWPSDEGGGGGGGGGGDAYTRLALPPVSARHRMDQTGQTARRLFTEAVLATGSDADYNLAVQVMRNPITAASILGTGASVGITSLTNTLLDTSKMQVVKEMSRRDPLTGDSNLIAPETKLGAAVAALFLSFFALAQALRLFVHFPFLVRASQHCRRRTPGPGGDCLGGEAVRACLRGQTFFSLGLRFLYLFIPLVMWTMGGTWLLVGTIIEVAFLFVLDQL